jgi:hypothetical protein
LPYIAPERDGRFSFGFVDIPGIAKTDVLNDFGYGNLGYLDKEVKMVSHEAEGMDPVLVFGYAFLQ